jgi:guanylate kinase
LSEIKKGRLVVLSAPSGTGKTTICRKLRDRFDDMVISVSYTTRSPRGKERNGVEYHFVDDATFDRMIKNNEFLEWANVFDRRYGSSRKDTQQLTALGKDVFFDIDVQGGQQIKKASQDAILIFLLPPTIDELISRLSKRKTETEQQMNKRLKTAIWELEQSQTYCNHVINDNLEEAINEVNRLRNKKSRDFEQKEEFVKDLIEKAKKHFG